MILLILLILLSSTSCAHDGRTRRLILGIESLPMSYEPESEVELIADPTVIEPVMAAVAYQTIVVEPPKKHKKSYKKKARQRRGRN